MADKDKMTEKPKEDPKPDEQPDANEVLWDLEPKEDVKGGGMYWGGDDGSYYS